MNFTANKSWAMRLGLATTLAVGSVGCKSYLDVNTDPNNPPAVTPSALLSGVEVTTGFAVGNDLNRVSSLLIQHTAGVANQVATYDTYGLRGSFDNQWNGELYSGSLINSKLLIDQAQGGSPAYAGIGKLLRAYNFALTTDLWGDIPYSQANLGADNLQPRFDKQQDIYQGNSAQNIQSLFDLVRSGLADINSTAPNVFTPGNDDVIYQGRLAQWNKFGNMMLLKLATTINRKNPQLAAQVVKEVLDKGAAAVMTTNADDAEVPFGVTPGNQNPIYTFNTLVVGTRPNDQLLSRRFLDSLRSPKPNDPRLPRFWTTSPANGAAAVTPFGTFTGFDNANLGTQAAPNAANRSRVGVYQSGISGEAPIRLLTNFQRCFILAESALRLGTVGDAQALFQEGIRASMTKAGVSATDITTYFTANPQAVTLRGTMEQRINQIITQKWIAWCGNGYEAYNDYRRTGYPRLQPVANFDPESKGNIPRRLFYPLSEINANGNNVPTPQPDIATAVWWDVR